MSDKKKLYDFEETLGAGSFGTVRKATVKATGEPVAIKIILKSKLKGHLDVVQREIELMAELSHPHIVKLIDYFDTKHNFYIVTQLATGGELFERLVQQTCFTEYDACEIIYQLLNALAYIHSKGIVHRDIKPENVLYLTKEEDSPVVLADFGVSKQVATSPAGGDEKITGLAGSYGYIAPEVYASEGYGDLYGLGKGGYTKACDIWSLGVVAYTLIGGYSPFRAETPEEFLEEVRSNNFVVFHHKYWKEISEDAKDFIVKSLDIDNRRRPSAEFLLRHPWIQKHLSQSKQAAAVADQRNIIGNIQEAFNAEAKLRKAVQLIMMKNRLQKLRDMRENTDSEFESDAEDFVFHGSPSDQAVMSQFSGMSLGQLQGEEAALEKSQIQYAKDTDRAELRAERKQKLASTFQNLVKLASENKTQIRAFQAKEASQGSTASDSTANQ